MAPKWSRLECLDNSRDLSRLQQFFFAVAVSLFFLRRAAAACCVFRRPLARRPGGSRARPTAYNEAQRSLHVFRGRVQPSRSRRRNPVWQILDRRSFENSISTPTEKTWWPEIAVMRAAANQAGHQA